MHITFWVETILSSTPSITLSSDNPDHIIGPSDSATRKGPSPLALFARFFVRAMAWICRWTRYWARDLDQLATITRPSADWRHHAHENTSVETALKHRGTSI
jgi:hypothetical protein